VLLMQSMLLFIGRFSPREPGSVHSLASSTPEEYKNLDSVRLSSLNVIDFLLRRSFYPQRAGEGGGGK